MPGLPGRTAGGQDQGPPSGLQAIPADSAQRCGSVGEGQSRAQERAQSKQPLIQFLKFELEAAQEILGKIAPKSEIEPREDYSNIM